MPKRTEVRANQVTMATFQAGRSVLVACWPCPGKEGFAMMANTFPFRWHTVRPRHRGGSSPIRPYWHPLDGFNRTVTDVLDLERPIGKPV
jgi:hypothetical protein